MERYLTIRLKDKSFKPNTYLVIDKAFTIQQCLDTFKFKTVKNLMLDGRGVIPSDIIQC